MAAKKKQLEGNFKERITAVSQRRVGDIEHNLSNPKNYTEEKGARLKAVLGQFGKAGVLLTYRDDEGVERFFDGNTRRNLDDDEVWYIAETDLTQAEVDDLVMFYDELAKPDWDLDLLKMLALKTAVPADGLLGGMLDGLLQQLGVELGEKPPTKDAEPQINRADELKDLWATESGQLWRMGGRVEGQEHFLYIGDAADDAAWVAVLGGALFELLWTDPPYGVAIGDKNKFLDSIDAARLDPNHPHYRPSMSNRVTRNLENDELGEPALQELLEKAFDRALNHQNAGGAWYVAAPGGPLHILFGDVLKQRKIWHQTIQWVKNNSTFSPMGVDYHWKAEPIFYGWSPGAGHRYYGGRKQTTVWEIDRPQKSPEHPTMKPIELVARAVQNSSQKGELVVDCFAGSGSTIVACENESRQARAIELDAGYAAVILQRYQDAFDIIPQLVDGLAVAVAETAVSAEEAE